MIYKLKTAPTVEPVTATEVKTHLRINGTDFDTEIAHMIPASRQVVEGYLNQSLITQTWTAYLDDLSRDWIYLMKAPVQSITHIKYYDTDNELQTLSSDDYTTDLVSLPGRIKINNKPGLMQRPNAVEVEFVAGYGLAVAVPNSIKHAILLFIGHIFENRGDEGLRTVPQAFWDLIKMNRVKIF